MKITYTVFILLLFSLSAQAQELNFNGMAMGFTNYTPKEDHQLWSGARYLPELEYRHMLDSASAFTINVSANIYGSMKYVGERPYYEGQVSPYRFWARYSHDNLEIRLGLQKIDFGSSSMLRPMQWFNGIDPRDPLGLTDGVYALLGRYYFQNNANIWLWGLYGNENRRGTDLFKTDRKAPEYGGRFQYPTAKGELAVSFHHKSLYDDELQENNLIQGPENKIGLDGKWDLGIGLWFEATYTQSDFVQEELAPFKNQGLLDVGLDYTLGIGNGLYVGGEHLLSAYAQDPTFGGPREIMNTTALQTNYPLTFDDNISFMVYHLWESQQTAYFMNFQHNFRRLSAYMMVYYNPDVRSNIPTNDFNQMSAGWGARLMLVYNH
ncbi:hypothetical protein [Persicobacter psychrovividus]|uniref:Porin n=1 Tax=Persicobacter psychrovividus TaxID=387638 RepID=A0ABN6LB77_9BACT|nr:hypothetical protein PEPS_27310 [Persicobacter psychrovividus]